MRFVTDAVSGSSAETKINSRENALKLHVKGLEFSGCFDLLSQSLTLVQASLNMTSLKGSM